MTINLSVPEMYELKPRITVFGVGGAGGNAVNNMIESGLEGVEFVLANTDAQALSQSKAQRRIQMGESATQGLGAGSHPEVGCTAAEEAMQEICDHLSGAHMVFVTAGMGGGTGTGAAPVIAKAAREMGILTVAVVTKPFQFEGTRRMRIAEQGLAELEKYVDTLLVIPNQNLFRVANAKTTFAEAFAMADQVLFSGVGGITDLMVAPGLINLDFADVRAVMGGAGTAMMGTGEASGETRANDAAEAAISNPLLEDVSMTGAKGVLINIIGGSDLTLYEVDEAANRVRAEVDPDANIIVGSTFDPTLEGKMRVSVVATGVRSDKAQNQLAPEILEKVKQVGPAVVAPSEQPALPSLDIAASQAAPEQVSVTPAMQAEPILIIDEGLEDMDPIPLSVGASDPVDSLGKIMAADAFISPRAAQPAARPPIVATRDTPAPQRKEAAGRQPPSLLVRMGLFGRKAAARGDTAAARGPSQGAAVRSNTSIQDKGGARSEPAGKPGVSAANTSELDIPAFLRRTAN
ncbi:MAG: cell division protein FtsZ [Alphaproteobacteria bacterium]|nr:cell division protein FtsZ [Alphaproteobacteria bacterium]